MVAAQHSKRHAGQNGFNLTTISRRILRFGSVRERVSVWHGVAVVRHFLRWLLAVRSSSTATTKEVEGDSQQERAAAPEELRGVGVDDEPEAEADG